MSEHRWALAVVVRLDAGRVEAVARMDLSERSTLVGEVLGLGGAGLDNLHAVRGPMCEDCRVDYLTATADPDRPILCRGKRPLALGGPLLADRDRMTRQQRRALQRNGEKANSPQARDTQRAMEMALLSARAKHPPAPRPAPSTLPS